MERTRPINDSIGDKSIVFLPKKFFSKKKRSRTDSLLATRHIGSVGPMGNSLRKLTQRMKSASSSEARRSTILKGLNFVLLDLAN